MKNLIVTGGTGGLGTSVVARLASDYRCILLSRHAGGDPNVIQADLADETSVRDAIATAVQRFGEPYGLLHMAGGWVGGPVSETSSETWQQMIGLNLTSSFLAIRETLGKMRRDAPGRIIAVSSEATITRDAGSAAYTVAKTGLNTLIEMTAAELAGTPITANALLPATLDTPASREAMPDAPRVPLGRVADAIAFLLSDAAAGITGALIPLRP
ncbi:MAG TPA: SDR family NAD(P)-dependent oxidoreductase [Thermoanaerobaculia bacterium]|nr:SDR family NAD(P)-dependent oxidoreductase [Thermoanaerobaculia bacterium]